MHSIRYLPILAAGAALAGLHGASFAAFVSVPVQAAGSQPLIAVNKKINLDTPTETQNRANTVGTITGTNITTALTTALGLAPVLKSSRTAPIIVNGVTVGTLYDRVWCVGTAAACASATASNTYVLGTRVQLNTTAWNPTGNSFEINDFFRTIRSTVGADAAYYRGSANPLPTTPNPPTIPPFPSTQPAPGTSAETASSYKDLETLGRTIQGLFEPSTSAQYANKTTNNAWIDFRADANKNDPDVSIPYSYNSEWSPWLLVRQVCATGYNATPQAMKMRLWEGGEEGQTPQAILTSAYVCN